MSITHTILHYFHLSRHYNTVIRDDKVELTDEELPFAWKIRLLPDECREECKILAVNELSTYFSSPVLTKEAEKIGPKSNKALGESIPPPTAFG